MRTYSTLDIIVLFDDFSMCNLDTQDSLLCLLIYFVVYNSNAGIWP